MRVNFKVPFFRISYNGNDMYMFIFSIFLVLLFIIGYFMNFQNIFQYFPDFDKISTISDFINHCDIKFVVSFFGVFITPLGVFCGYIF